MARPARHDGVPLDPAMPVALYLALRADAAAAPRLAAHVAAFCDTHPNTTLHQPRTRPRHLAETSVVAYLAIDGGPLRGAVRGETTARQATLCLAAAVTELFMFDPVLVPRPPGIEPSADDVPDRLRGAP